MLTIQQAYQQLLIQLYEIYNTREAAAIAELVFENITGFKRIDRILNKQFILSEEQTKKLNNYTERLLQHEPVQYVLGEVCFADLKLFINKHVLIPRPETEELVDWIIEILKENPHKISSILDIGTGSGCIAIGLKKALPEVRMYAVDVSENALSIANANAQMCNTKIEFSQLNILEKKQYDFPLIDIIVSNPPYIKESEKLSMQQNVLSFEPELALFVPDTDPLIYYKSIISFALNYLKNHGTLFLEINETIADELKHLLELNMFGFIEIKKDLQQKDRMIKASLHRL